MKEAGEKRLAVMVGAKTDQRQRAREGEGEKQEKNVKLNRKQEQNTAIRSGDAATEAAAAVRPTIMDTRKRRRIKRSVCTSGSSLPE